MPMIIKSINYYGNNAKNNILGVKEDVIEYFSLLADTLKYERKYEKNLLKNSYDILLKI